MNWLNKLEEKFGRYAIRGLPKYIVGMYLIGFLIQLLAPSLYNYLYLNPYLILHGQVWRLVTFLLISPTNNLIFIIFVLFFYYSIGTSLEQVWGSFRFNMYYFVGVIGTILGSFLTYFLLLGSGNIGALYTTTDTFYLNMSLFLAYAMMFPEREVLLYMIIPLKVKWLAYLDAIYLAYIFISSGFTVSGISVKVSIAVAFLNFVLFFFSTKRIKHKVRGVQRSNTVKKAQRQRRATKKDGALHECAVCHRTELDDPTLEFRYCSKCEGNYEYCQDHLFTHEHIKKH